jgi:cytochrome P450
MPGRMTSTTDVQAAEAAIRLVREATHLPDRRDDPHALLEALHEHGRHVIMPDGYVAVWDYEECVRVMSSQAFGREPPDPSLRAVWHHDLTEEQKQILRDAGSNSLGSWLQLIDAPDHTRQRLLVTRAFTPKRLADARPMIERIAHELLEDVVDGRDVNFIAEVAAPFSTRVVGELVGLPIHESAWFAGRTREMLNDRDPGASFDELVVAARANAALGEYTSRLIEARRQAPADDLITALIEARDGQDRLSEAELVAMVTMLYIAGHGTTAAQLSNTLYALLRHPAQLDTLRADRSLLHATIEEGLRYDPNVLSVDYCAREDNEVLSFPITRGTPLHLFLASANRDPKIVDRGGTFDILRADPPHIAFGYGPHYCLGAALARMELEIMMSLLLDEFPVIALTDAVPVRRPSFNYRELETLHLRLARS